IGSPDPIRQFCFSPSGKLLAARYDSGKVSVWRLDLNQPRLVARAFGTPTLYDRRNQWLMECMYFVDDNRLLKLESHQARNRVDVRQLDISTGKVTDVLQLPQQFVQQGWVAAKANKLYVTEWNTNIVRCFDLGKRTLEREYVIGTEDIWSLQLSADESTMVVTDFKGNVQAIDTASGKTMSTVPKVPIEINSLGLSSDGA